MNYRPFVPIYFATRSGSSKKVARIINAQLSHFNINPALLDLKDTCFVPPQPLIIFVIPSYGKDKPPQTAEQFYENIFSENCPRYDGIQVAIFGIGSSNYVNTPNCVAVDLMQRFIDLGASNCIPVGFGDRKKGKGLYNEDLSTWLITLFEKMQTNFFNIEENVNTALSFNKEVFENDVAMEDDESYWDPATLKDDEPGFIHSVESFSGCDGEGVRYLVFLQGCRLRCLYCCNPDTWCLQAKGQLSTPANIQIGKIVRAKPFWRHGGGVTLSGGDPLLQPRFTASLLKQCKENDINTCLEVTGDVIDSRVLDLVLPFLDTAIICFKGMTAESYSKITRGGSLNVALSFLHECIKRNVKVWITYVLVPGYTDTDEEISLLCDFVSHYSTYIERIELLPYHNLGDFKWENMGLKNELGDLKLDRERIQLILNNLKKHHNNVLV
eukprot:TRINITY_DN97_c0_g1_i1.p1 TRINITY_DN97_c0_g1~~TRINITY_DN97_c0_g1_i1.p1  ORF type:complete len:441 (+),score=116.47 TRINITY_DN97_c0_g1_i1:43-1365(+)